MDGVVDSALERTAVCEVRLDHHVFHLAGEHVDDLFCGLFARCRRSERPAGGLGIRLRTVDRMKLGVDLLVNWVSTELEIPRVVS